MAFLPTNLQLGYLKINGFGSGSAVSFGDNLIIGRNVVCKKNQGYGEQNSDHTLIQIPIHAIFDADVIDSDVLSKTCTRINQ